MFCIIVFLVFEPFYVAWKFKITNAAALCDQNTEAELFKTGFSPNPSRLIRV